MIDELIVLPGFLGFMLGVLVVLFFYLLPVRRKKWGNKEDAPKAQQVLLASPACCVCGTRLEFVAGRCPCGELVCALGNCKERHELICHDEVTRYA